MKYTLNTTALLIGVLIIAALAAPTGAGQMVNLKGHKHVAHTVHYMDKYPCVPLRQGTNQQIVAYYKNSGLLTITTLTIDGASLMCLTVDEGSGLYIDRPIIYRKRSDTWVLFYYGPTLASSPQYVSIKFSPKGSNTVEITGSAGSTHRVLHTLLIKVPNPSAGARHRLIGKPNIQTRAMTHHPG